jgi:hypothetical protein
MSSRRILVSYRRADTQGIAGRIFDRLVDAYGRDAVFIDVDSIPIGTDFRAHIRESLDRADVVLLIIGPRWTGPRDGQPARIFDADDPVRIEAECALEKGVAIIPVLVSGATMPLAADLPESLHALPFLNAATVDAGLDFHQHAGRLLHAIDRVTGHVVYTGAFEKLQGRTVARSVWTIAVIAAMAMPVLAAAASVQPPWPPGVSWITAVLVLVALLLAAQFLRMAAPKRVNTALHVAAAFLVAAVSVYLFVSSFFTYVVPTTHERFVKGYKCTSEAQLLFAEKCPYLGVDELQTAEYEAERLWTASSVAVVKVSLVGLWLASFIALSFLLAALLTRYLHRSSASSFAR